jgi:hypothetical protein
MVYTPHTTIGPPSFIGRNSVLGYISKQHTWPQVVPKQAPFSFTQPSYILKCFRKTDKKKRNYDLLLNPAMADNNKRIKLFSSKDVFFTALAAVRLVLCIGDSSLHSCRLLRRSRYFA